jgi:hypothetical protein
MALKAMCNLRNCPFSSGRGVNVVPLDKRSQSVTNKDRFLTEYIDVDSITPMIKGVSNSTGWKQLSGE